MVNRQLLNNHFRVEHGWPPERGQVVILDNRDSFVFNLAHRLFEVGIPAGVIRSDEVTVEALRRLQPSGLVVSPGPGHPEEAGISVEAIRAFSGSLPILGVCLGHQAIATAFGGTVVASGQPMHGMASEIEHDGSGVLAGIAPRFLAARYHSLMVNQCPESLVPNAWAGDVLMGFRHARRPTYGVQFHPESVLTDVGLAILANFGAAVDEARSGVSG